MEISKLVDFLQVFMRSSSFSSTFQSPWSFIKESTGRLIHSFWRNIPLLKQERTNHISEFQMLILLQRKEKINWPSKLMTLSQTAEFISMLSSTCQIMSLNFIKKSWSHRTQFLFQFSDSTNGQTSSFQIESLEMSSDTCLTESTLKDSWVISLIDQPSFWRETSLETLISMKKWFKLEPNSNKCKNK